MNHALNLLQGRMGHAGRTEKPYVFMSPMRPLRLIIKGTLLNRIINSSPAVPSASHLEMLHKHGILATSRMSQLSRQINNTPENYRR